MIEDGCGGQQVGAGLIEGYSVGRVEACGGVSGAVC